ncbi:MAG: efflux RND transporter periplasmic adaptor subunit [Pseudomonadota bacterium]
MSDDTPRKPSRIRTVLTRIATVLITLAVVSGALALLVSGREVLANRAAETEQPAAAPRMVVEATRLAPQTGYAVTRRFTGQIEAAQVTRLGFESPGTLDEILVDEGDRVAKGQLLAAMDLRLLNAERAQLSASKNALEAQAELARRTEKRRNALNDRGFASDQSLDTIALSLVELQARISEVDAALASVDIRLDKARMRAPFDATVSARERDPGVSLAAGQPVLSLMEDGTRQFRVGVSPDLAGDLSAGQTLEVYFGNRPVRARLTSILPDLDPATRTRMLLLALQDEALPAFGTVGELRLSQQIRSPGFWLPLGALRDGPRGLWQVMAVVEEGAAYRVVSEAVEILHAEEDRVFVRGTLTTDTRIITGGPHRVVPGQRVLLAGGLG